MSLEKDLAKQVKELLDKLGITYLVHRTDKRSTGVKGWPDLTFAYCGTPVVFELKTPKGILSPAQVDIREKLAGYPNGWYVYTIRSLEDAVRAIEDLIVM